MKRLLAVTMLLAAAAVLGVFATTATAQGTDEAPAVTTFCWDGQTLDMSADYLSLMASDWSQWIADGDTIYMATFTLQEDDAIFFGADEVILISNDTEWTANDWFLRYTDMTVEGGDQMLEWVETTIGEGACVVAPVAPAPEPARIAYCSVAGNTLPNGTPVVPGTFLNLLAGQPGTDTHYTGATPAFWVEGVGLTCSLTPAQAALASASTVKVGGGGTPLPAEFGGFYTFIPLK